MSLHISEGGAHDALAALRAYEMMAKGEPVTLDYRGARWRVVQVDIQRAEQELLAFKNRTSRR